MAAPEQHKRPRRNPLSREEVEAIIEFKKRKEQIHLYLLKKTVSYKVRNLFLIICFFIFCEVLICFFGPARHRAHYTQSVSATYNLVYDGQNKQQVNHVEAVCVDGEHFRLMVNEFIKVPNQFSRIDVYSDFLMNCQLKASIQEVPGTFPLFRASPVILLSVFCSFILLLGIHHNLNQQDYTLWGLTVVCGMTVLYLICV